MYGVLKEAEHRSTFYIPYWNIPATRWLVPRQRAFHADLAVINECLDGLISCAKRTRVADDAEALQARDYSKVGALRFAYALRGKKHPDQPSAEPHKIALSTYPRQTKGPQGQSQPPLRSTAQCPNKNAVQ